MFRNTIIETIDAEIEKLKRAKALLSNVDSVEPMLKRKGLSEEGRKRIAEAQKRRWAKKSA